MVVLLNVTKIDNYYLCLERIEALATETLPILLLGDFNSPTSDGTAYQMLLSAEYIDLWQMDTHGNGQDPEPKNPTSELYKRIDLILIGNMPQPTAVEIQILGNTSPGRYPSDHARIVAHMLLESYTDGE